MPGRSQMLNAHGAAHGFMRARERILQVFEQIENGAFVVDIVGESEQSIGKLRLMLCAFENPCLRHPSRHPIARRRF